MGKVKITKEEALSKFQAAKDKKRECLKLLEKTMKLIRSVQVKKLKVFLLYDEPSHS